jgi:hypothetical protein
MWKKISGVNTDKEAVRDGLRAARSDFVSSVTHF